MVPFAMILVPHLKALSSWVVTLLVGAVVIGAIEEEVVACEQELQHGLRVTKSRGVQARAWTIFFLRVKAL
jgi:hypothetical protein